jgi:hypothetical protein
MAKKPKAKPKAKPPTQIIKKRRKSMSNDKFSTTPQKTEPEKGVIANRDQDPNHPANKTPSTHRERGPRPEAEGFGLHGDDLKTEQEKGGRDPIGKAVHSPGPVETIEELDIGPRTPYPTGSPPSVHEEVTRSQGVKGATVDKPDAPKPDKR